MAVTLTRFSQEVDVASGSLDVAYFAIFSSDDGRELKLPITPEASQAIIAFFADKKKQASSVMDDIRADSENELIAEEDRQAATTFGGDVEEEEEQYEEDDVPDSEESVPSV